MCRSDGRGAVERSFGKRFPGTASGRRRAVWEFSSVCSLMCPRRPAARTDGETSGRGEGALALLLRKRYRSNAQKLNECLTAVGVCSCVSLVLPRLARRQDVGVVVGGDLKADTSRLIGGAVTSVMQSHLGKLGPCRLMSVRAGGSKPPSGHRRLHFMHLY